MERAWLLLIIPVIAAAIGAFTIDTYEGFLPPYLGGAAMGFMLGVVVAGLTLAWLHERDRKSQARL